MGPVRCTRRWLVADGMLVVATSMMLGIPSLGPAGSRLFGRRERQAVRTGAEHRLNAVLARHAAETKSPLHDAAFAAWRSAVQAVRSKRPNDATMLSNALVNALPYRRDIDLYGVEDRWSTPLDVFRNGGDCECAAIAKMLLLVDAGAVPIGDVRLVLLAPRADREAHAVVAVASGADFLILDNRVPEVLPSASLDAEPLLGLGLVHAAGTARRYAARAFVYSSTPTIA